MDKRKAFALVCIGILLIISGNISPVYVIVRLLDAFVGGILTGWFILEFLIG